MRQNETQENTEVREEINSAACMQTFFYSSILYSKM